MGAGSIYKFVFQTGPSHTYLGHHPSRLTLSLWRLEGPYLDLVETDKQIPPGCKHEFYHLCPGTLRNVNSLEYLPHTPRNIHRGNALHAVMLTQQPGEDFQTWHSPHYCRWILLSNSPQWKPERACWLIKLTDPWLNSAEMEIFNCKALLGTKSWQPSGLETILSCERDCVRDSHQDYELGLC